MPGVLTLPSYMYRVHRIEWEKIECEIQKTKDFKNSINAGRLVGPTMRRPTANIRDNMIRVAIDSTGNYFRPTAITYLRKPSKANWTYVVVNKQAMYSASGATVDFDLHSSEETNLVYKILKFAGVSSKQQDLVASGQSMETAIKQQQPKS